MPDANPIQTRKPKQIKLTNQINCKSLQTEKEQTQTQTKEFEKSELSEPNKQTKEFAKRKESLQNVNFTQTEFTQSEPKTNQVNSTNYDKLESLLSHLDQNQTSKLKKYPNTTLAIMQGKEWKELEKQGWEECKKNTYYSLKTIIRELDIKTNE